ncbi:serine-aspartate repeat-containing protein I-like [Penaeus monodon]|uniref:serine-aspartate repeat-containing protein I-like n=1 Tax=Penaeus monodon TaxID=6687 RepID=UPI0018A72F26|nr:serine-aspartate repeat-containing protein I-like [Penaeus monodon]
MGPRVGPEEEVLREPDLQCRGGRRSWDREDRGFGYVGPCSRRGKRNNGRGSWMDSKSDATQNRKDDTISGVPSNTVKEYTSDSSKAEDEPESTESTGYVSAEDRTESILSEELDSIKISKVKSSAFREHQTVRIGGIQFIRIDDEPESSGSTDYTSAEERMGSTFTEDHESSSDEKFRSPLIGRQDDSIIEESESNAEEPESSMAEEPESSMVEEPESSMAEEPESSVAEEPESSMAEEPESSVADEPESSMAEEPESSVAEEPESMDEDPESNVFQEANTSLSQESEITASNESDSSVSGSSFVQDQENIVKTETGKFGGIELNILENQEISKYGELKITKERDPEVNAVEEAERYNRYEDKKICTGTGTEISTVETEMGSVKVAGINTLRESVNTQLKNQKRTQSKNQ